MKGVLGAVPQSGDRFQVVIGGGVATVYENIMHLPEMANTGAASIRRRPEEQRRRQGRGPFQGTRQGGMAGLLLRVSRRLLPPDPGVLLGASIIIALVNLLISLNVIPNDAGLRRLGVRQGHLEGRVLLPADHGRLQRLQEAQGRSGWLGGAIMAILMTPQLGAVTRV